MPIRMRNLSNIPHYFRFMQPHKGGNLPHSTYYAFYLRDPIAILGFVFMLLGVPFLWCADFYIKHTLGKKDILRDPRVPYSGYNIGTAARGNWKEARYGDGTDVGAVYEMHFDDGTVQTVQDYPASYASFALKLKEHDQKYLEESERAYELQKRIRAERQREWLRLNGKEEH